MTYGRYPYYQYYPKYEKKVVLNHILAHVDNNSIIPIYQSGFRKGHNTKTALFDVTDNITEASGRGMSSILVLLDYSRAFDCLHPELF